MEITLRQQYNVVIRTLDMISDRRILLYEYDITSSVLLLLIYGFTAVSNLKASEIEFGE